jgi:perosamine synthetase
MSAPVRREVPLCRPALGEDERRAVLEVLDSGWLAHGPRNAELEASFRELTGATHAIAMNSCAAALQLAIQGRGIGGEVVMPSFTFVASANTAVLAGATPVFADIDRDTRCLDPAALEAAIGPRTEAVMVVHYAGQLADMEAIPAICEKHGLALIEDSAEAIGATFRGRPGGGFGDGCFSFFATKNITTGEGGLLATSDDVVARKARALIGHGIESTTEERERKERPWRRVATGAGYNFRMSNLLAAIGVEQMKRLGSLNAARASIAERYLKAFGSEERLELPVTAPERTHVWQMFTVLLRDVDRSAFLARLRTVGVGASVHFDPPVHAMPPYADVRRGPLDVTDDVVERIVTLPMFPTMTDDEVEHVVGSVRWALDTTGE